MLTARKQYADSAEILHCSRVFGEMMKNKLNIFGLFLFVCSGAILSSAQISCGVGKKCVRPERCKTLNNDNGWSDNSACETFERCCVVKRNVSQRIIMNN